MGLINITVERQNGIAIPRWCMNKEGETVEDSLRRSIGRANTSKQVILVLEGRSQGCTRLHYRVVVMGRSGSVKGAAAIVAHVT